MAFYLSLVAENSNIARRDNQKTRKHRHRWMMKFQFRISICENPVRPEIRKICFNNSVKDKL